MTPHNLQPSGSKTEVVGGKTREELEWLSHFESQKDGRPSGSGWFTTNEMAAQAGTSRQSIERYIQSNAEKFERSTGTIPSVSGRRRTSFYRFIPATRLPAEAGNGKRKR